VYSNISALSSQPSACSSLVNASPTCLTEAGPRLGTRVDRYSFPVRLFIRDSRPVIPALSWLRSSFRQEPVLCYQANQWLRFSKALSFEPPAYRVARRPLRIPSPECRIPNRALSGRGYGLRRCLPAWFLALSAVFSRDCERPTARCRPSEHETGSKLPHSKG